MQAVIYEYTGDISYIICEMKFILALKDRKVEDMMDWQIYSILCLEDTIVGSEQMTGQLNLCKAYGDESPLGVQ